MYFGIISDQDGISWLSWWYLTGRLANRPGEEHEIIVLEIGRRFRRLLNVRCISCRARKASAYKCEPSFFRSSHPTISRWLTQTLIKTIYAENWVVIILTGNFITSWYLPKYRRAEWRCHVRDSFKWRYMHLTVIIEVMSVCIVNLLHSDTCKMPKDDSHKARSHESFLWRCAQSDSDIDIFTHTHTPGGYNVSVILRYRSFPPDICWRMTVTLPQILNS